MDKRPIETHTTEPQAVNSNTHYARVATTKNNRIVISRAIWFIIGVVNVALGLRIMFFLLGANQGSAFVDFLYSFSNIFAAPFNGIFPTPAYGSSAFDTSSLVAIVIYSLAGWGIVKLINITNTQA